MAFEGTDDRVVTGLLAVPPAAGGVVSQLPDVAELVAEDGQVLGPGDEVVAGLAPLARGQGPAAWCREQYPWASRVLRYWEAIQSILAGTDGLPAGVMGSIFRTLPMASS